MSLRLLIYSLVKVLSFGESLPCVTEMCAIHTSYEVILGYVLGMVAIVQEVFKGYFVTRF